VFVGGWCGVGGGVMGVGGGGGEGVGVSVVVVGVAVVVGGTTIERGVFRLG